MINKIIRHILAVVCDYEGVFTPNRFRQVEAQALLAIQGFPNVISFIKSGAFTFCTGRSASFLEGVLQLLGLVGIDGPCVVENGAALWWPKRNEVKYHPSIAGRLREVLEARVALWMFAREKNLGEVESGKDICLSFNPLGDVSIGQLHETIAEEVVREKLDGLFEVTHSHSAVDVTPLGINKGSGVEWQLREMGILPEAAMYVGDSSGDLPAMELVGVPTCPVNAGAKVKELVARKNGIIAGQEHVFGLIEILCAIGALQAPRRVA